MQIGLQEPKKRYEASNPLEKGGRRLHEFAAKFSRDWMMFSAAGLAYSLMIAVVPFGIAILAVLGFTLGTLNPNAQAQLVHQIQNAFPSAISSQNVLQPAITRLSKSAGFLTVLAVVTAIFGGSRLFIAIARCFDIVYRTHPRKAVPQYVTALLMMLVFIVLTPIMVFASSLPAIVLSLVQNSALNQLPGIVQLSHNSFVLGAASLLGSLIVAWILFQAIYMAVPNQRISFKNSWIGAIVAAFLLEIFLALFPLYIAHFMSSYTGVVGFAIIFLLFFYYFAVILLFGAQINAYFAEGIYPLPDTLAAVLHDAAANRPPAPAGPGTLNQAERVATTQASAQIETSVTTAPSGTRSHEADIAASGQVEAAQREQGAAPAVQKRKLSNLFGMLKKNARKPAIHPAPKKKARHAGQVAEAVVGTALAFTTTLVQLRKKQ